MDLLSSPPTTCRISRPWAGARANWLRPPGCCGGSMPSGAPVPSTVRGRASGSSLRVRKDRKAFLFFRQRAAQGCSRFL